MGSTRRAGLERSACRGLHLCTGDRVCGIDRVGFAETMGIPIMALGGFGVRRGPFPEEVEVGYAVRPYGGECGRRNGGGTLARAPCRNCVIRSEMRLNWHESESGLGHGVSSRVARFGTDGCGKRSVTKGYLNPVVWRSQAAQGCDLPWWVEPGFPKWFARLVEPDGLGGYGHPSKREGPQSINH